MQRISPLSFWLYFLDEGLSVCIDWPSWLVFWLAYGEFCDELPATHYLSVSVSHIACHVITQSSHKLLTVEANAAAMFSSDIHVSFLSAVIVLLVLCSVAP